VVATPPYFKSRQCQTHVESEKSGDRPTRWFGGFCAADLAGTRHCTPRHVTKCRRESRTARQEEGLTYNILDRFVFSSFFIFLFFTARRSYAIAVLGVVILHVSLSVCPSVCHTRAL